MAVILSIISSKGFMYTLMGIFIWEAGRAGNKRAAGSEGATVACLAEPQDIKNDKVMIIRTPGKIFMTGMEGFEL